jgi:dolichyl-diphosphooligosaccharide--protein glycosyltransferase
MSSKLRNWHWLILAFSVILGLYIRISNPWDLVFVSWMEGARLSGNDPWYYFRLIDSLDHNFPYRIWYDAFTNYPYGTYTHFGPFVVYLSYIVSKLAGAGTPEAMRSVVSFIPVLGGVLLVFPVYVLTSRIFNKNAALFASLLIVLIPGQLLHRSVLSFNDHHIWETFWQLCTIAAFAVSIKELKANSITSIKDFKDFRMIKYPLATGIALGMYLLTWAPGFIIALVILAFVFLAYLLKHHIEVNTVVVSATAIIAYLIGAIIYLPVSFIFPRFATLYYNPFQLLVLLSAAGVVLVFRLIEVAEDKVFVNKFGDKSRYAFPAIIVLISLVFVVAVSMVSPDFFNMLKAILRVVQPKGGALTVAEVQPFFIQGEEFTLAPAWRHFSMTFFFAIPGMAYVVYLFIRKRNPLHLFVLVWGFAMLVALTGQNRFAYYFGAVSAIFAAVMLDYLLERLKFYELISGAFSGENRLKKIGLMKPAAAIFLAVILFYPTLADVNFQAKYSAGGINKQWYDALVWMRDNTPGKEMYEEFYYELYQPTPDMGKPYPYYPEGTYGVMSWWDYGHWITAVAHRIPNANPFQQGIGNKYNNVPGAAPFFTAYNESEANAIADKLGVRYVISDVEMATGKFYAMAVWAEGDLDKAGRIYYSGPGYVYVTPQGQLGIAISQFGIPANSKVLTVINIPSENYFRTMEAKFHIMDGSGLKNYRMVYESGFESTTGLTIEMLYRYIYDTVYAQETGHLVPVESTGYVKVFEYVKGAKITGRVGEGIEKVILKANITTNQNRTFVYQQVVEVENGVYEFIVPYSQKTVYPVKASEYRITAGNVTKSLSGLTDTNVLNGDTFTVDFV